ncbi:MULTISPECIES: acyltransferase family protein [unclassified Carboxylicivirga]|uniref:acyltransferase family protein n=1 Tax=Carboxylicivirga TaxID=1628153 RepID=UPI003D3507F7
MHPSKRIYFPNLNGLRFIAAFLVIIHHIEQFKAIFQLPSYWTGDALINKFIRIVGGQGVILFFVLSGFLITYLLLAEEQKINTIKIKKFYMRRILRIWPLYLAVVLLSLFAFPHIELLSLPGFPIEEVQSNLGLKLFLYLFFFANLVLALLGIIPYASQTWSIGTEEQFYLLWPVVIRYIKKNRLLLMVAIVIGYNAIRMLLASPVSLSLPYHTILREFWAGFKIDTMAIGGFFAVMLFAHHPPQLLKLLKNRVAFNLAIAFAVTNYLLGMYYPYINNIVYSGCYAIIILNFAANPNIKIKLENKLFNALGNISYGLYMLHPIAIVLCIKLALQYGLVSNWFLYPASTLLTIAMAQLSYHRYEKIFLKFKSKFAIIKSGSKE